jgi:signal transduction histidine kinase
MIRKILHIDPNPTSRQWVGQVLAGAGYTVVAAADGLAGLNAAQTEPPDLILIALDLPGMTGYEVATRLKGIPGLSAVPVVALASQPQPDSRPKALAAGCAGYLTQPLEADQFLGRLAQHLAGWQETLPVTEENSYLREYNQQLVARLAQQSQEFSQAAEVLAHTDLMKSRFINMAGHELRTPLTALRGYLSLLTAPNSQVMTTADANTQEIIEGINSCVDRLQGIVQDMLDMTRIEMGTLQLKPSPVSLAFIFNKIGKEFAEIAQQRQQTLRIADPDHIPMMWVDGERITQILRNLVSNAIKYTPDGGKIKIEAELMPSEHGQADWVKITISDTGIGVSPDHHEAIFQSFYEVRDMELHSSSKTDFMGGGAGLGLPIARGVAEAHGGSLQVESPGHDPAGCPGSKFHLTLPLGNPAKG